MLKSAIWCALGFFEYATFIVVLIATLEPNAAVRSGNFRAGETPRVIQLITNCLAKFAVCIGGCRHRLVLWRIKVVNRALAVRVHRHGHPHGVTAGALWCLGEPNLGGTNKLA